MTDQVQDQATTEVAELMEPQVLIAWEFSERPHYERGLLWYGISAGLGIALLIYAVATANFLFALLILLFALVIYLNAAAEPRVLRMAITERGIQIGREFLPFSSIESFRVVYEPPVVQSVYLRTRDLFKGEVGIDLSDVLPEEIRPILGRFLKEDRINTQPTASDFIGRFLKL